MEPGERAAPDLGQARARRPRLHAGHVRRLGLAAGLPAGRRPRAGRRPGAARPGQPVGVRAAHRRRPQRLRAHRRGPAEPAGPRADGRASSPSSTAEADDALAREGFAAPTTAVRAHRRRALLRAGLRGAGADAGRRRGRGADRAGGRAVPRRAPRRCTATTCATTRARRSSGSTCGSPGSGPIRTPGAARGPCRQRLRSAPAPAPGGRDFGDGWCEAALYDRRGSAPATWSRGPAVIEEFGSTVPVHPGFRAAGRRAPQPADHPDRAEPVMSGHAAAPVRLPAHRGRRRPTSTRCWSRSSRATWPASRWRWRRRSPARRARR